MSKVTKVAIVLLAIFVVFMIVVAGVRFLSGDEDGWLCSNGQWMKHGNPSAPMPVSGCGVAQDKSIEKEPDLDAEKQSQEEYEEQEVDDIRVNNPKPDDLIKSPLEITGEARGSWFFEANFPVMIMDETGKTIGTAIAEAQGEWMTENFVPFTAKLKFYPGTSKIGFLILNNDDPSGDPAKLKSVSIPVRFK